MNNNISYSRFINSNFIIKNLINNDLTSQENFEGSALITETSNYQTTTNDYNVRSITTQDINYGYRFFQLKNNGKQVFSLQTNAVSGEEKTNSQPLLPQIKSDAATLFNYLKNEPFTPGYLSVADRFFEEKHKLVSNEYLLSLLNKVAMFCYADLKKHSYLHFLNLLKNASFYMSYDDLKIYAALSLAKDDSVIKDLAISIFEGFSYTSEEALQDAINCLQSSDTTLYPWLTEYKNEVISDLQENFKG